jgi:hypothetical protein
MSWCTAAPPEGQSVGIPSAIRPDQATNLDGRAGKRPSAPADGAVGAARNARPTALTATPLW